MLACVVAAGLCAAPAPALAGPFHGLVTQTELDEGDYQRMRSGGATTLRVKLGYQQVPPQLDGSYHFDKFDKVVDAAARNGVRILPFLHARPAPLGDAARADFADFAEALAERYGRRGDFWVGKSYARPIVTWQVLNEQNSPSHWGRELLPNPAAYVRILKAVAGRIRAVDPRAEIALGGMYGAHRNDHHLAMTSWSYLRQVYRQPGARGAFDTVAVHPYDRELSGVYWQIRKILGVIRTVRDRQARLRITEFGWGSAPSGHPHNVGLQGQAKKLTKSFRVFWRKRRPWRLRSVNWFAWEDSTSVGGCGFCGSSGLFNVKGQPKPSWWAFRRQAR